MQRVRCPICRTAFRISETQLNTHSGIVRCGHCYAPFNARLHLEKGVPPLIPEARDNAASSPPKPVVDDDKPEITPAEPLDLSVFLHLNKPPTESSPNTRWAEHRPTSAQPIAAATPIPGGFAGSRTPATSFPEINLDLENETEDVPSAEKTTNTTGISRPLIPKTKQVYHSSATTDLRNSQKTTTTPKVKPLEATTPIVIGDKDVAALDSLLPQTAAADSPLAPRHPVDGEDTLGNEEDYLHYGNAAKNQERSGLLALGVGLLLGVLIAQCAYLYRNEITANWPRLRPLYLEVCERIGCQIELPRNAAAIAIETSDLQSDPYNPERYILNTLIRNSAAEALQYPHLELTLTDVNNRVIARRALSPQEWLPEGSDAEAFAPGAETSLHLPFEARSLNHAVGYRLYAFYP